MIDQLSSEEGWTETLSWIRNSVWPKRTKNEKHFDQLENKKSSDVFSLKMRGKYTIIALNQVVVVVSIAKFISHFVRFCTVENVLIGLSFLLMTS